MVIISTSGNNPVVCISVAGARTVSAGTCRSDGRATHIHRHLKQEFRFLLLRTGTWRWNSKKYCEKVEPYWRLNSAFCYHILVLELDCQFLLLRTDTWSYNTTFCYYTQLLYGGIPPSVITYRYFMREYYFLLLHTGIYDGIPRFVITHGYYTMEYHCLLFTHRYFTKEYHFFVNIHRYFTMEYHFLLLYTTTMVLRWNTTFCYYTLVSTVE